MKVKLKIKKNVWYFLVILRVRKYIIACPLTSCVEVSGGRGGFLQ